MNAMKTNILLAMATLRCVNAKGASRCPFRGLVQTRPARAFIRQLNYQNLRVHKSAVNLLNPTCVTTQRSTCHPSKELFHRISHAKAIYSGMSKEGGHELSMTAEEVQISKGADAELLQPTFKKGDLVMAEVIYFGPLGASVDVVAHHSHDPSDCISHNEPALGRGMILQREINYFRQGRGGVDVIQFEIIPAYFENAREVMNDNGEMEVRLDISLRPPGGRAKAEDLGAQILQKLKESDGPLNVGDKSSPEEINKVFPGASKNAFKKAISNLYRRGLVSPGRTSTTLM